MIDLAKWWPRSRNEGRTERRAAPRGALLSTRVLRWASISAVGVVTLGSSTMLASARPASADELSDAQAQASQLEQQIEATGQRIDALDQQYEAAQEKRAGLDEQIFATQASLGETQQRVDTDRASLRSAAVNSYIGDESAASQSPLFSGVQRSIDATQQYNDVGTADLNTAVQTLQGAEDTLNAQQVALRNEDEQAQQAVDSADIAYEQAQNDEAQQQQALSQVNGEIGQLVQQQQEAQTLAAISAAESKIQQAQGSLPAPPPSGSGQGAAAVAAAESQLGVPYVWGGETPGVGFDCSGLTAWSWGQAGVPLDHYSGSQMSETQPVPVSDLQPGDLLFYGPGGSDHVAMYIGSGEVIQAPYPGAVVSVAGADFGDGFAGAGRP